MTAAIRAPFPTGTTATTAGGTLSITTSVTIVAGDALEVHNVFNGSNDAGITVSCKLDPAGANLSPDGTSGPVHSNGQTAGFETVFYYLNPPAGTYNVTVTFSATSGGSEQKCYAISGTNNQAPAITTFHPTGTGVTTAASITSPTIPTGGIGISHFCAGSSFSSTGQTTQVRAQNGSVTDAANAIAGASVAGTGATVNMTATISSADWYAAIATAWAPAGAGGSTGAVNAVSAVSGTVTAKHVASGTVAATTVVREGIGDDGIDQSWFTDYNGNPQLLVNAEDWGLLSNGGLNHSGDFSATFDEYFTTRAAQGYNSWYGSWCSFTGLSGGRNGSDSDGTFPFSTSMDPTTTPNSTFWARRDALIASAAAHGFRVILSLTGPYLHRTDAAQEPQRTWTTTQWTAFGTFIGNRYKNNPNIMWMVGDDYFDDINTGLNALKTALRAAGAQQPISIQYYVETASKFDEWSGSPGVAGTDTAMASFADWNQGYSYNVSYDIVEKMAAWNKVSGHTPVPYAWLDGFFLQNAASPLSDVQLLRRMIWWALSSGSRGFTTGDDDIWPWPSTALAEIQGTASNGLFYNNVVPAIASYFKALPNWHLLEPDLSSQLVTAGRGTHVSADVGFYGANVAGDSDNYVTASRTPDGSLAVIYMSKGTTITIDQTKMGAGYSATWVDPKTCATSAATVGSTYNSTAKGNNSDGLNEWVLVLKANPASGTVAGHSSTVGTATAKLLVAATVAAASTVAGAATANHPVSGTVAASSSVAGSALAAHPASGTVAGTSSVAGAVTANHPVSGVVAAVSGVSGSATAPGASGSVAATSGVSGSPTMIGAAVGTVAAVSGVSGSTVAPGASGTVAVTSGVSGAPTVQAVAAGTVAAVSGSSGSALPPGSSSGTVVAVSGTAGAVTARYAANGTVAISAGVAGGVTATHQASGQVVALASLSGTATATYRISGAAHAVTTVSGDISGIGAHDGSSVTDPRLTLTATQPVLSLTTSQPTLTLEEA